MNVQLISHRAYFQDCYPLNEDELQISIKTGKDVEQVYIYYSDPFDFGVSGNEQNLSGEKVELKVVSELKTQYIWRATIKPTYKRAKYYFEIKNANERIYLFEDDFYDDIDRIKQGKMMKSYIFPWMNSADLCKTPDWVSDMIWYQIFPDSFSKAGTHKRRHENQAWNMNDDHNYKSFYGGDIAGIKEKLPYIKELGITGIYLNPILLSDTNHKYDINDYSLVDPDFGTEQEFIELVKEAHRLGIKVMVDAVFNHCGFECSYWQDVVKNGPDSKYYSWFFVHNWPFDMNTHVTKKGDYFSFAFSDNMPKWNTNNPEVVEYLIGIAKRWVTVWGVDGIRVDVANEVSHQFLKQMRSELKAIKPDLYFLGEIWHDSFPWLLGDEFDSVMNYPFLESMNNFWLDPDSTSKDFMYHINRCYNMYYEQVNRVIFNLLDSHDTDRLMRRCQNNKDSFYQQLAVLFSMQGSPCIYYGTEIGMNDANNRKCMPWDAIEAGQYDETLNEVKKLISLRNENVQLRRGTTIWNHSINTRLVEYKKHIDGMKDIHIFINVGESEKLSIQGETVLYARKYKDSVLENGGIIVLRVDTE